MNLLMSLLSKIFLWKKNTHSKLTLENSYLNREISFTLNCFEFNNGFKSNVRINGRFIVLNNNFVNHLFGIKESPIVIIEYNYRLPSPINNDKFTIRKQGSSLFVIKGRYNKIPILFKGNIKNNKDINCFIEIVKSAIEKDLRKKDCGEPNSRGK